jgi:CBS domain-containing protein
MNESAGEVSPSDDELDLVQNDQARIYSDPLERALAECTVAEIQARPFTTVPPEWPVRRALEVLSGLEISCLMIEEEGRLVGVFSERDVLDKVAEHYEEIKDLPVSAVMTRHPVYVHESDAAAAALSVMAASGYRHVPVLGLDEHIVGIVSPQRVAAFLTRHFG